MPKTLMPEQYRERNVWLLMTDALCDGYIVSSFVSGPTEPRRPMVYATQRGARLAALDNADGWVQAYRAGTCGYDDIPELDTVCSAWVTREGSIMIRCPWFVGDGLMWEGDENGCCRELTLQEHAELDAIGETGVEA